MKQLPELKLGVNIDHIATLRQARGTAYPDPVAAALLAEQAGADGITLHLREDRRHIQDADVARMHAVLTTRMNLEMAATTEMIKFASDIRPAHCCIVPEKRAELTTEGGLDLLARMEHYRTVCGQLGEAEIEVSLFIDPDAAQVEAAHSVGAPTIELHTGVYANALNAQVENAELARLQSAITLARELGLKVNAGHGLNYDNIKPIAALPEVWELNIGHAIVAQAVFVGLTQAIKRMKKLMSEARQ